MSKSLRGRVVVVTRPAGESDPLADLLRSMGAEVVAAPLTKIAPPRSWRALDEALKNLDRYAAVVFASANAVEGFFTRLARISSPRPRPRVIAAVGPATARRLARRGWTATIVAQERRAEGLAKSLRLPTGSSVLIPRAERGNPVLPRLLRNAGLRPFPATAYRTAPNESGRRLLRKTLAGRVDAVCFASGSAVDSAVAALGGRSAARALDGKSVAIGPVTAASLRRRGITPAAVAAAPGTRELARAVARLLAD